MDKVRKVIRRHCRMACHCTRFRLADRRGITLIEIVVSIALFSILLLILASVLLTGLETIAAARSRTDKSMQAAGAVNQYAVSSSTPSTGSGTASAVTGDGNTFTIQFGTGSGAVVVSQGGSYVQGSDGPVGYKTFQPDGS